MVRSEGGGGVVRSEGGRGDGGRVRSEGREGGGKAVTLKVVYTCTSKYLRHSFKNLNSNLCTSTEASLRIWKLESKLHPSVWFSKMYTSG